MEILPVHLGAGETAVNKQIVHFLSRNFHKKPPVPQKSLENIENIYFVMHCIRNFNFQNIKTLCITWIKTECNDLQMSSSKNISDVESEIFSHFMKQIQAHVELDSCNVF